MTNMINNNTVNGIIKERLRACLQNKAPMARLLASKKHIDRLMRSRIIINVADYHQCLPKSVAILALVHSLVSR